MTNLIVVGGGGHAKVIISLVRKLPGYRLLGYTDADSRGPILGAPYLGDDHVLPGILQEQGTCAAALGVGAVEATEKRATLAKRIEALGFELATLISPRAVVNQGVDVGRGTVILDGAVVNAGTRMGLCCILNSNCTVEHDCDLGQFVHVAPAATLSGGVRVGSYSLIGTGANVVQYISIGDHCLIGAGATVVSDIAEAGVYVGTPARRLR
jgi:sugar O-acyltransferase (sialic acid O-acetyltransferase NeuD family)